MREYCLVTKNGEVINMAKCYEGRTPYINEFQVDNGYSWVPVEKVSATALRKYRFWDERA